MLNINELRIFQGRLFNDSDDDITVNSVLDAINNVGQRQNRSLKIVELVKGPIKRSVVVSYPPCSFPRPHTLAPNAACTFNHTAEHGGGDGAPR